MRKWYILIILITVILLVTYVRFTSDDVEIILDENGSYISKYAFITKQEWESIDLSDSNYSTVNEFLLEIDSYVESIAKRLNRYNWVNKNISGEKNYENLIEFKFTYSRSEASGGGYFEGETYVPPVIKLNRDKFEQGWGEIVHELTHVIAPYTKSKSMSEGLACYIQDTTSRNNKSFKGDVHIIVSEHLGEYKHLSECLGNSENGSNKLYSSERMEILLYYAFSDSFTHYIIEEYGIGKYLSLYESELDNDYYKTLFGIGRDELIQDWKEFVSRVEL